MAVELARWRQKLFQRQIIVWGDLVEVSLQDRDSQRPVLWNFMELAVGQGFLRIIKGFVAGAKCNSSVTLL